MRGSAAGRLKVVIVGAGIGGLSAHLAFARAGFEVAHYERRSELGPAGAGIVVWPDGVKVLRALGLGERLAAIGNRPDVLEVRGLGLMIGVELRTPALADDVAQLCFRRGLLVLECGQKAIRFAPPLILSEEQAKAAVEVFARACADAARPARP